MVVKRSLLIVALASIISISGCSAIRKNGSVSPRSTPDRSNTTSGGQTAPWLPPTSIPLSSPLLSVNTPTTTVTETLATAMVTMLPYSDTLLYSPVLEDSPEVRFVETTTGPDLKRTLNEATNRSETFRAFTACNSDPCHEKIFTQNLSTGQIFEIQFPGYMAWRPITQMNWLNDNVLLFTHPSQPSYGHRYAVNVGEQRLLLIILLTNECFAYGKCG